MKTNTAGLLIKKLRSMLANSGPDCRRDDTIIALVEPDVDAGISKVRVWEVDFREATIRDMIRTYSQIDENNASRILREGPKAAEPCSLLVISFEEGAPRFYPFFASKSGAKKGDRPLIDLLLHHDWFTHCYESPLSSLITVAAPNPDESRFQRLFESDDADVPLVFDEEGRFQFADVRLSNEALTSFRTFAEYLKALAAQVDRASQALNLAREAAEGVE